jgi:hypothetical protein
MYPKDFSIVLYLLLVAICAYLLCTGKLTGRSFVSSLLVSALAVAILHNLDALQRLAYKGPGWEATAEFERVKREVYAKADAVRQMTEGIGSLLAYQVATAGRYGGDPHPDHVSQLIESRDKLRDTLIDAGTSKERIEQILAPFAQWIPFDLRSELTTSAQTAAQKNHWEITRMNQFLKDLSALLNKEPYLASLSEAEHRIHDAGLSSLDINLDIERYRTYLTTGGPIPPKLRK